MRFVTILILLEIHPAKELYEMNFRVERNTNSRPDRNTQKTVPNAPQMLQDYILQMLCCTKESNTLSLIPSPKSPTHIRFSGAPNESIGAAIEVRSRWAIVIEALASRANFAAILMTPKEPRRTHALTKVIGSSRARPICSRRLREGWCDW
jgi:hypothetical protein